VEKRNVYMFLVRKTEETDYLEDLRVDVSIIFNLTSK
jgi:hypothetical protein